MQYLLHSPPELISLGQPRCTDRKSRPLQTHATPAESLATTIQRGNTMSDGQTSPAEAADTILRLKFGGQIARIVRTTVELGLADHLSEMPTDVESLARVTETHAPTLARLLRSLAAIGVVAETGDHRYTLAPLGAALRTDAPGTMRASVLFLSDDMVEQPWRGLTHAVRTGDIAFNLAFGTDQLTYLSAHPASAGVFDNTMREMTRGVNASLVASYPFADFGSIVDVGGGIGSFLLPILEQNPTMHGIVFELPHVARRAREHVATASLASRCEVLEGNALDRVPPGADAYVFKSVIHMHGDENTVAIFRNCREAIPAHGKLILIERLLPDQIAVDDQRARANLLLDVSMMLFNGGRERTEREYAQLLDKADLRLNRAFLTVGPQSIIEAIPA
jgi:hypothetical protein